MLRQTHRIELRNDEREFLKGLVDTPTTNNELRVKAEVLLLADQSEDKPCLMVKDIAAQLQIGETTVKRVRYAYKVSGTDFLRPDNETPDKTAKSSVPSTGSAKPALIGNEIENEIDLPGCELASQARYRVILTSEERELLNDILRKGKHSARRFARAKILLNADQGDLGPGMQNEDIAEIAEVSTYTVDRVRKLFVGAGVEGAINFKHHNAGRKRKLDGRGEAHLISLACSTPPAGCACWTLRLLRDSLVELEIVDEISHVSVGETLKKTKLNLGKRKSG